MKVFSIIEHGPADSGHTITIVQADTKEQALHLYKEHTHRDCLPSWLTDDFTELTDAVTQVYRYDNPNYEG